MLKGKSVIELTNIHTGEKEIYEDENLVTEAVFDVLNTNLQGLMYDSPSFDSQSGEAWLLPIYSRLTGGVLLYQNEIEEDPTLIYAPLDNPLVGYASNDVNTTEDVQRGSRNLTESKTAASSMSGTLPPRRPTAPSPASRSRISSPGAAASTPTTTSCCLGPTI